MNSPFARLWTITNNNQFIGSLFIEFPQKGTIHLSEVISSPLMPPVQQAIVAKIMIDPFHAGVVYWRWVTTTTLAGMVR